MTLFIILCLLICISFLHLFWSYDFRAGFQVHLSREYIKVNCYRLLIHILSILYSQWQKTSTSAYQHNTELHRTGQGLLHQPTNTTPSCIGLLSLKYKIYIIVFLVLKMLIKAIMKSRRYSSKIFGLYQHSSFAFYHTKTENKLYLLYYFTDDKKT